MNRVVLILGEDPFLAREVVSGVIAAHPDLEVSRHAGDRTGVGDLLDEARTPAMFGPGRLVLVEDAAPLLQGETLDALAAYAEKPAPSSLLVIQSAKLDGRLGGAKRLKKAADVREHKPPADWDLPAWAARRAREGHGLTLGAGAAEALCERVGGELGALEAALARLTEQIAPLKRLEAADVHASTGEQRSPALFEAANALESADLPAALRALDAAFRQGIRIKVDLVTDPNAIAAIVLSNLHGAYARLVRFHMLRRSEDEAEAAKQAGCSPRAVRFFVDRARRHRLDRLVERHRHFVAADAALKRSTEAPQRVLEQLVLGLLRR